MSRKYYVSLLVYSIVKISSIVVWMVMISEGTINSPLALREFIKPIYAILTILLLILLPKVPAESNRTKKALITLVVGLLILNQYITIRSFFPISLVEYQNGEVVLRALSSLIFCVAIVMLIYESIKYGNFTSDKAASVSYIDAVI